MNWILTGILIYIGLQLLVAAAVSPLVRSEKDYLLAGRTLGFPLAMFSIFATWFGAETCIGAAGVVYGEGIAGSVADPFGYAVCLAVMGAFFAARLRRYELTTLPELFARRFGSGVERLAVLLMVPTSIFWAAAQIRAFAQVLSASSDWSLEWAIVFAAAVVIIYTMWGGLMADVVTDFVQGLVLIAGLVILAIAVSGGGGGLQQIFSQLTWQQLSFSGGKEFGVLDQLERWSIPIFGSLVAQELISRVLAARSPRLARGAALSAAAMYLCIGLLPLFIGLAATVLVPGIDEPEQVLAVMAQRYLSPLLYVVFAGALMSAILSTVDSALLAASALLAHNLVLPFWPEAGEGLKLRVNRGFVFICGVIAYTIARGAHGVYALVEEASAFGSAGLVVIMIFALFTSLGGAWAATASLLAGVAVWIWASYIGEASHPYILSLAAAIGGYFLGAVCDRVFMQQPADQLLVPAATSDGSRTT